jgi:hypothetical protein
MRSPSQPANGLTQLTLSDDNGSFTASGDVVCGASICPTGVVPATTFATDAAPRTGTGFTATFQTIPVTGLVVGMVKDGVLSVKAYNAIPDGVVNPDGTPAVSTLNIEQFQKVSSNGPGGALRLSSPGRSARAWRDAARGAGPFRLSPMARLHDAPTTFQILGDWTATATATSGIARISLQSNGSGLTVHAYGVCQPVPCDWQSSPGIGYAARLDSDIGIAFSAVFQVGPQEILVTGDLENTSLVVTYFSTVADDTQGPNTFGTQSFQLSQPRQGA